MLMFIVLWMVFGSFQVLAAVNVSSVFGDWYGNSKAKDTFHEMAGDASVEDLYFKALEIVKEQDVMPMYDALEYATVWLNDSYSCALKDEDLMQVLLVADDDVFLTLQQVVGNDLNAEVEIDDDVFIATCDQLMQCVDWKKSMTPHTRCKQLVVQSYSVAYRDYVIQQSFDKENYGKNLFQNGNEDDSSYDLLIDIQNIGNLLFEGNKPTVEVLFYQFPEYSEETQWTFWNNGVYGYDGPIGTDQWWGGINWMFGNNGEFTEWFQCPQDIEAATNTSTPPGGGWGDSWEEDPVEDDEEVGQFVQVGATTNQSQPGLGVLWNICIKYEECGNGVQERNETCDDENIESWDGCSSLCQLEYCGDGIIQEELGEVCDDANPSMMDICVDCQLAICWDGEIQLGIETCDDGNTANGDGCNSICQEERWEAYCGDGEKNLPNEECDDGDDDNTDICLSICKKAVVGDDYIWNNHEECDDGNVVSGDGCSSKWELESGPYCGDGVVNVEWEKCDLWSQNGNNNECKIDCTQNICGDGYIYQGKEQCDDGNTDSFDCCDSSCQNEEFLRPEDVLMTYMQSALDELKDVEDEVENPWCFSDCDDLPISDRILCMAECACDEFSSPEMLSWVVEEASFRIKFCMVPAQSVNLTRGKHVYSIEEIFVEMETILQWLKDSGEMPKSTHTKEFLEISTKKNNFASMFAPNVITNWKPSFLQDDAVDKRKAKKNMKNMEQAISNLGGVEDTFASKNKYVVIDDVAANKAASQNYTNSDQFETQITQARNELQQVLDLNVDNVLAASKLLKTAIVSEEVMGFLDQNLSFWMSMNGMFEEIGGAVKWLKNKITSSS